MNKIPNFPRVFYIFWILVLVACSRERVEDQPGSSDTQAAEATQNELQQATGEVFDLPSSGAIPRLYSEKLEVLRMTGEGLPQIKRVFRSEGPEKILDRIEFDLNEDGRIDFIQNFDPRGQWVESESADLNGDGSLEITSFFKLSTGSTNLEISRQEIRPDGQNQTWIWKFYDKGSLVRREISRKKTGRPDYWEYYSAGRLLQILRDENGDGSPDSQPDFKPVGGPKTPEPGKIKK